MVDEIDLPTAMNRSRLLALVPLLALPFVGHADDLGVANPFNVFVFGSMQSHGSDTQGRVAVGGSASLTNYSVGHNYAGPTADTLIVGGALAFDSGSVEHGAYWAGGAVSFTSASGTRDTGVAPLDFNAAKASLLQKSSSWSGIANTATALIDHDNGGITLNGSGTFSVFTVTAAQFAASHNMTVINAPAGSTVLINVSGTAVTLNNSGYQVNGSNGYAGANVNVVYNFYEAATLQFSGSPIGALLAPKADVTFNNGALYGTLVANNLNVGAGAYQDSGQFDQHLFGGNIPTPPTAPSAVPAPGALASFGVGALATLRRRRRA